MCDNLKSFNSIFLETIELDPAVNGDYLEVVKEPVWLPKSKEVFPTLNIFFPVN